LIAENEREIENLSSREQKRFCGFKKLHAYSKRFIGYFYREGSFGTSNGNRGAGMAHW